MFFRCFLEFVLSSVLLVPVLVRVCVLSCSCSRLCSCSCSFSCLCLCSCPCSCSCLCPCSCSSSCLCSCLHVRACVLASCCSSSFATTLNLFLIFFSYHFLVTNFIWTRICLFYDILLINQKNLFVKSACDEIYCYNGGTCQSGFTVKRYRCLCPSGFKGKRCQKGRKSSIHHVLFYFYYRMF